MPAATPDVLCDGVKILCFYHMGQAQSQAYRPYHRTGRKHAVNGWAAFLSDEDMRLQAHYFKMKRTMWGRRVFIYDSGGGCIQYAKLSTGHFQRLDAPCTQAHDVPKFPSALAAKELPHGRSMPYQVVTADEASVKVRDPGSGACATYRRTQEGWWFLAGYSTRCRR